MEFRRKMLLAAVDLQASLGIKDLGQFFYKPIKCSEDCTVLVTVSELAKYEQCNSNLEWTSLNNIVKKVSTLDGEELGPSEVVLSKVNEMILSHQRSNAVLPRGLYMGYLKLKSSMNQMNILVSNSFVNVLPYVKIRESPDVTREEWEFIRNLGNDVPQIKPKPSQQHFREDLNLASVKLLNSLNVSKHYTRSHRLYDSEVIRLNQDVSFIPLLPPVDCVCTGPAQQETPLAKSKYMPIQAFEITNLGTYQHEYMGLLNTTSSALEVDLHRSKLAKREAFSTEEVVSANEISGKLSKYQQDLEDAWESKRWTKKVVKIALDKTQTRGISLDKLLCN
ncbi:ankyrin repeat and fibronectin type-III domain-containing protein 1 [Lingula anatina]|uniref:Ankyrin repeat and fibronectin type-III domain-containing protein 1 n=1 Tax=Lingula anatina TaxID=7574 RepID=A0A2R2MLP7_LINAN|nr:ankyrin repeat and fibronectin type-III domain-containing protein 1 [Lingula anatina]|eukprot:XP_023931146.1 ankyrin repeat and fibronectin type-III domain-containing protein 1 [Lingula anatina]